MPAWKDLPPEEQERRREEARARTKSMWDQGKFGSRKGGGESPRREPAPVAPQPRRRSSKGDIVALGTLGWNVLSLPVGLVSPYGAAVMRHQSVAAGRDIDTLLKGTAFYDSLTSGATAEKAVAAYHLLAPVTLCVVGETVLRMQARDPDNPQIGGMLLWIDAMLQQALAAQGLPMPAAPVPPARPRAREARDGVPHEPEPEPPASPPDAAFDVNEPIGSDGNGAPPRDVAAAAAAASRFDHVE